MPPRRSTRSTRASVEPQAPPQAETNSNPGKRKRSVQPPIVDVVVEKENVEKPPSTRSRRSSTNRSSTGTASRSRTSTRNASALEEVAETDDEEEEEEEEEARPAKKKRPSVESVPERDEDEDEAAAEDDDEEEEEFEEKKKPTRGRRTTARKVSAPKGRAKRAPAPRAKATKKVQQEEEEDSDSDGEPELVSRAPDAMDEDDDEPPARRSSGRAPAKKPSSAKASTSKQAKSPTPEKEPEPEQEEEEEEKSLLDPPPPLPIPIPQPQTITEPESNEPKARLVIHKLALVNFKSYGGRQEIGPFHKSFSSIVGPNGSGKSNTIDALLFVFGYRATKMRQGKLGELIHNSARYPDLDECCVEVYFREITDLPGPDAYEVVPGSELVVARHAYKNNTSKYTINRRQSTFSEVQTLLKGRGIDLDHKRFLILQGEVESIALMKPKASSEHDEGLLEYLEDIIGTAHYKEPIQKAVDEVEQLTDLRQEKFNRLKLVEKEKDSLEAKKKEAIGFLKMTNDCVKKKSILYQIYVGQGLEQAENLEGTMKKLKSDLEKEQEKNKDDVAHLEELEEDFRQREVTYKSLQKLAQNAQKDLAEHEKKEVGANERRKHASGKVKKLKKSVADETNSLRTAKQTNEDSTEKIIKEKKKLQQYEVDLVKEEQALAKIQDSLKDKTQVYYDQKEVLQRELQPWNAKIDVKQSEIDIATSERDELVSKAEQAKREGEEAEQRLATLQADMAEKTERQAELKATKSGMNAQRTALEKKIQDAETEAKHWERQAAASNRKVQEAKASQAENKSQNRVLNGLNGLRDSGRIEGFHGRLGSLATIPEQYDVAVSTACAQLHHMVVDTVEQGQRCIEYLRTNNIGRATFMTLEKLSVRPEQMQPIQTPENVPRLFDLITIKDSKFRPAFYKALQDTLVARDIEQANRIAYGPTRWRVVTLAGQMFELSGTMSGGGNRAARGAMSSKFAAESVRPEVMRGWEQETQDAEAKLREKTEEMRDAQTELAALKRKVPDIDMEYEKLGLELTTGKARVAEAEKAAKAAKAQSKPNASDVARIAQLEKAAEKATADLNKLNAKAEEINDSLKEIDEKILQIGGSKLLSQKSKVESLRVHISLANDEITKAEVAKTKAEKDTVKYTSSLETNQANLEELEKELKELDKEVDELVQYVAGLKGKVAEAQEKEENSKEDLDKYREELEEKMAEVQKFKAKEAKIQAKIDDVNREYQENEKKINHWYEKNDELRFEEIDEELVEDDDDEEGEGEGDDDAGSAEGGKDGDPDVELRDEDDIKPDPDAPSENRKKATDNKDPLKPPELPAEQLKKYKHRDLAVDIEYLEDKLDRAKPNLNVLAEWKKRMNEVYNRFNELEEVTKQRDEMKKHHDELRKKRLDEFMTGFSAISLKLKEMYQMITMGGNAELELVDSMDPFSEGIIFSVMPPKKSWKNIANLSGGEKTLSSLALVFALHVFKPTPLYFMDEIDAALDFRNVSIVANYIKDRTKNAQFIIISLRNDMFELSHRLIGIYKTANVTHSISIDNHALPQAPTRPVQVSS
ncbi:Structural maintenance of chromosomes protein 4 [Marasmius tenuissimus]|nr:Structural maintenance of chromosomes protein 4 [Marasmius tenuissimus]